MENLTEVIPSSITNIHEKEEDKDEKDEKKKVNLTEVNQPTGKQRLDD